MALMDLIPAMLGMFMPYWTGEAQAKKARTIEETNALKEANKKSSLELKKLELMESQISKLPVQQQIMAYTNPKMFSLFSMLMTGQAEQQGQQFIPESTPEPYETPTGKFLPAAQNPQSQQPNLLNQLTQGQLGYTPQQIAEGMISKEIGLKPGSEVNRTMQVGDKIIQILNNGTSRPAVDNQGQALVIPPEAVWHEVLVGDRKVKMATDKYGKLIMQNGVPLTIDSIAQNQQFLRGMAGGPTGQATIPIPQGGFQPGTVLPEAVKGERLDVIGPREEVETSFINPYTLQPQTGQGPTTPTQIPSTQTTVPFGGGAIRTKAPQPAPVTEAAKRADLEDGVNALLKVKDLIFNKDGSINRTNLFHAMTDTPWTEGKFLRDFVYSVIDPIQRARSGAVIRPEEEGKYRSTYSPQYTQKDEQVRATWAKTINYLRTFIGQLDPDEAWVKDIQNKFDEAAIIPKSKGGVNLQPGGKGKGNTIHFEVGQDEYFIPPEKIESFIKQFPNARRLSP